MLESLEILMKESQERIVLSQTPSINHDYSLKKKKTKPAETDLYCRTLDGTFLK